MSSAHSVTRYQSSASLRGFTLIEVLVAMSIFAVVSVMAFSGLRTVINVSGSVQNKVEKLEALQRTFMLLERDLYQLIPRKMNADGGDVKAALEARPNDERLFEFTRGGQPNPADVKRSSLIRVAYLVDEETLKRLKWNNVDHLYADQAIEITLLENVEDISARFLDAKGQWVSSWGQKQDNVETIPNAIEITLKHKSWGEVRWLIPLN